MENALAILQTENQELRLENMELMAKLERLREDLKAPMELLGLQRQGLVPAPEPDIDVFMAFEDGTLAQDLEEGIGY